jgi:hypothetical protein
MIVGKKLYLVRLRAPLVALTVPQQLELQKAVHNTLVEASNLDFRRFFFTLSFGFGTRKVFLLFIDAAVHTQPNYFHDSIDQAH